MSSTSEFTKGIYRENPVFRLALGLCPALAVSSAMTNGIGMGIAATFVLLGSNIIISLIRGFVPSKIRIPCYIVVIATFVTIADLAMAGFAPELHKTLGIFVPLIVVNCIILGRAEAFASKNSTFKSILDALGMGIGFTFALLLIAFVRELLGSGKLFGITVLPAAQFDPVLLMILPPGAFLMLGLYLGLFQYIDMRQKKRKRRD
jgi:electron transport complex protein RnfE